MARCGRCAGWAGPPAGTAPYQPDPVAVLSVLAQSVPVTSGGYATRSHGVLTSLAARGWRVEAVTRLGFPYDRWPQSDERVVPAHAEEEILPRALHLVPHQDRIGARRGEQIVGRGVDAEELPEERGDALRVVRVDVPVHRGA